MKDAIQSTVDSSKKIRFEKSKGHIVYKLNSGKRVPGASTISKLGDDPTALIKWANNEGLAGRDCNKVRDESADIGTLAHFMIQCHLRGEEPDLSEFSSEQQDKAGNAFLKFLDFWQAEKLTPLAVEKAIVSEDYGYGGTLDCVAMDGGAVLLDYKTSNAIYRPYLLQLAGYEQLWNEEHTPDTKIARRAIVRIGKTEANDLEVRWLSDMTPYWEAFKCQLELYRAFQRLPKNGE